MDFSIWEPSANNKIHQATAYRLPWNIEQMSHWGAVLRRAIADVSEPHVAPKPLSQHH